MNALTLISIGIGAVLLGAALLYAWNYTHREEIQAMFDSEDPAEDEQGDVYPHQMGGACSEQSCRPSASFCNESNIPKNKRKNPYEMAEGDPGHDLYGQSLESDYCRDGLGQIGIVEGENELWRHQVYTVQPSSVNLKFFNVHM